MTIHEIKRRTADSAPNFFEPNTLQFFGQTLNDFKIRKLDNTHFYLEAPIRNHNGRTIGKTKRIFNTETDSLEFVPDSIGDIITR
jgi:hypothetical protein